MSHIPYCVFKLGYWKLSLILLCFLILHIKYQPLLVIIPPNFISLTFIMVSTWYFLSSLSPFIHWISVALDSSMNLALTFTQSLFIMLICQKNSNLNSWAWLGTFHWVLSLILLLWSQHWLSNLHWNQPSPNCFITEHYLSPYKHL